VFLRILGGLVMLAALLWVVMYVSAGAAMRDAKREPWPYGLGSIDELDAYDDKRTQSKEAKEIAHLIADLAPDESSPKDYVDAQTAKKDDAIDPPPDDAGLKGRDAPLAELVRAVNGSAGRVVWGEDGAPWQSDDAGYLLAAAALDRARNGDAARAWDDLHAAWLLASTVSTVSTQALPPHPPLPLHGSEIALIIKRAANAVARKLPGPSPPWAAEISASDPRRDTAALIQQATARRVRSSGSLPGPLIIFRPMSDWIEASNVRRSRASVETMAKSPRCRIDTAGDYPHAADIYRAARIEAELEATAKVLALKNERARLGRWPASLPGIETSRCGDSRWIYKATPAGDSMTLRMSWEVAAEPENKTPPALQFDY
jgi:hypothetical protein